MLKINNHRLVEGGKVRPYQRPHSPQKKPFDKTSGPFREGWLEAVVIHFTAASKKSSLGTLLGKPRVSCQIIIDEAGNIFQTLDFNERAWHAGTSKWNGKEFWNNRSIGIELVNNGPLTHEDGRFKALFGKTIAPEHVICSKHRNDASESLFWEKFPAAQLDSAARLTRLLTQTYKLDLVLGHDDISPIRKIDPGPAFPMEAFKKAVFDGIPEGESFQDPRDLLPAPTMRTTTPGDQLSLRKEPLVRSDTLITKLPDRTEVEVVQDLYDQDPRAGRQTHRWAKVKAKLAGGDKVGYVSKRYLTGENLPEGVRARGGMFAEIEE